MRRVAYQIVELNCGDTLVDTVDDLHCYGSGIDVLWVKAITEPRYTSFDLVELDALLAAICMRVSEVETRWWRLCLPAVARSMMFSAAIFRQCIGIFDTYRACRRTLSSVAARSVPRAVLCNGVDCFNHSLPYG